jgi:hypothetical protein
LRLGLGRGDREVFRDRGKVFRGRRCDRLRLREQRFVGFEDFGRFAWLARPRRFVRSRLYRLGAVVALLGLTWRSIVLRPVWIIFVSHPGLPSALAGSAIRPRRRRRAAAHGLQT